MIKISLKRLISKKDVSSVIKDVINSIGGFVSIQDIEGRVLVGNNGDDSSGKYPVKLDDKMIGWVIGCENASSVAVLLSHLANREYEKKALIRETLEKYKEIILLYRISEQISANLNPNQVSMLIIDEAQKLIKADNVSVMLMNESKSKLQVFAASGNEYNPKTEMKLGKGIAGCVFERGKAEIVNDVLSDPRFIAGANKVRSIICAPLKTKDKVIGVINLSSEEICEYTSEDLKLLASLATQAASAIENARLVESLVDAKERAETSDRLKSNFLNTISHEVSTPLNIILGHSDLLASSLISKLSPKEKEFFDTIRDNGNRLKHLIDDILSVSLIEAGKMNLNWELLGADAFVKELVKDITPPAQEKNLAVVENYRAGEVRIKVDRVRLKQALWNILLNAVKFTQKGHIEITTRVLNRKYLISVADTGVGIDEIFKPYLFTLFRQQQEGYSRSYEGAGLGLAISHRLIDAMGGHIEVPEKEGQGSTFIIFLPVAVSPSTEIDEKIIKTRSLPLQKHDKNKLEKIKKVLIIEDNPANLQLVEFLVKKLGLTPISATSGEEALELLANKSYNRGNHSVDVMLIDISLGEGMSGVEFLKHIKMKQRFRTVPKLAVTAHSMVGQIEEFLKEGFDDYLAKPFTLHDLKEVLNRVQ